MMRNTPLAKQVVIFSLVVSLPLYIVAIIALYFSPTSRPLVILTGFLGLIIMIWAHHKIHEVLVYKMRSLSSALDALVHGEYTLLTPTVEGDDVLGEVVMSINKLALNLRNKRWDSIESQLLFNMVIDHIDVSIIAFDNNKRVVFVNLAACRLLKVNHQSIRGGEIAALEGVHTLDSGEHAVLNMTFSGHESQYQIRIEDYREAGQHRRLVFITDVSAMIRKEEAKSWQKLVRVIGHEINNSLSPIASISETLKYLAQNENTQQERNEIVEGLEIIRNRANSLGHFVNRYKEVTKIPEPSKQHLSVLALIGKVKPLFLDITIAAPKKTDIQIFADPIQLEQVIINIVKNAQEATEHLGEKALLQISWEKHEKFAMLLFCDNGRGISNVGNLFTPFYSTKKTGSGIGLAFCRQVINAHGGKIYLKNTDNGCCAIIELPYL